jgi:hypothetical protein
MRSGCMVLLGEGEEVSTGGVTTVAAPERRVARRRKVPALRRRTRCWSAQQSAITRGDGGARHRHLTVRRVDLHVHLLGVRVGAVMKTY